MNELKERQIARFCADRDRLIEYLKMKVEQADWHGVSDAANDIRVLEAANSGQV